MTKKQRSLTKRIFRMLLLFPAIFSLTGNLIALMKLEMKSVRNKLILFIALMFFSFILMISLWLCLSAIIISYLLSVNFSIMTTMVIMMSFNLLLFIITCLTMALMHIDPTFPETRKAIQDILSR